MNLLCGLKDIWYNFYNNYIRNIDDKTKTTVGVICLMVSIGLFILCTKGHDKANMVNSWFLFWLSLIVFVVSILFLTVF